MTPSSGLRPASCKECRRLKLKCDKKVPCSSCVRRGCPSICATGNVMAKGSRFILANTEELHEKIDILIARIHSLEGALEASHSLQTSEEHPLLRKELRALATPFGVAVPSPVLSPEEEELAVSIGTLTLDGHGSRYFGSTGAFASLWNGGGGGGGPDPHDSGTTYQRGLLLALADLPLELVHMAHAFPIRIPMHENVPQLGAWILDHCLPSYAEAWSLFENYWEHFAWLSSPFTRSSFIEQILSPLYHNAPDKVDKPLGHRLALLFSVFAIGRYMDLTQPMDSKSSLRYYMLARASLCLEPVFENPTVTALQAMYLISIYLMLSRVAYKPEHGWILSGINMKLALTLGLQHDANKFGLPPTEVEARRQLMVSVVCHEAFECLLVGRQTSFTFPNFDDWIGSNAPDFVSGSPLISLSWTPGYIRDCIGVVIEAAKETKYSAILQADAKIRRYPVPDTPKPSDQNAGEPPSIGQFMQQNAMCILKESPLLYLHRRFFALALQHFPDDPLKSPFGHSVMACYRSTVAVLTNLRSMHAVTPEMVQRLWFLWPSIFVATLVLGSIVARSPNCSLASPALLELEMVCRLWESTSGTVCGPKILATVRKLKHKAFKAFSQAKASNTILSGLSVDGVEVDDEIAALGGGGPGVIASSTKVSMRSLEHTNSATGSTNCAPSAPAQGGQAPPFLPALPSYPTEETHGYKEVDAPGQFADFPIEVLTADINRMFQGLDAPAPKRHSSVSSSILEELGLSGGWQPVMDDLGL